MRHPAPAAGRAGRQHRQAVRSHPQKGGARCCRAAVGVWWAAAVLAAAQARCCGCMLPHVRLLACRPTAAPGHDMLPDLLSCTRIVHLQMLRVVESLPLTSDDMHHTRSAHGSFADLLRDLAQSTDFEVTSGNRPLRRTHCLWQAAEHRSSHTICGRSLGCWAVLCDAWEFHLFEACGSAPTVGPPLLPASCRSAPRRTAF